MNNDTLNASTSWSESILNSGWKFLVDQFNKDIDWYTVDKETRTFEENQDKSRYYNVDCYDWNRIKLKDQRLGHDFYHANSVHLKEDENFNFIAAQGPLSNTIEDFWSLIYHENVSTIVQLCNFTEGMERIRCARYWPSKDFQIYGNYTVTFQKKESIADDQPDITLRTFTVQKDGGERIHTVQHLFYSRWPDFSVPQTVSPLVKLVRWIEERGGMGKDSPILVHCLAGIGRTGTLIATLMALHTLRCKEKRDDLSTLMVELSQDLRRQRAGSIQSAQQYIYAHAAVMKILAMEGLIPETDRLKEFRYVNPPVF